MESTQDDWGAGKVIIHLDMDAFFAAVEQTIHPALKGKPVIVGGTPDSRGVVATCSYEARNYGIHSAMPMRQAYQLCPDAIYIDTSGEKYSYLAVEILKILKKYTPLVEPISIDESFMDITRIHKRFQGPEKVAMAIKDDIKREFDLTASIGIAPYKFIAKMASSSNKPDGLVVIPPSKVRQFLWVQPVEHLWGVGPKSAEALHKIGISSIGDLANVSSSRLTDMFGIVGTGLLAMANGKGDDDVRAIDDDGDTKSMSHEHTFAKDTMDTRRVLSLLLYLSDKVSRRLRLSSYVAKTVNLKIRKSNYKLITRAKSLNVYIDSEQDIYRTAKMLLYDNGFLGTPIRLIGVSVSNLKERPDDNYHQFLFQNDSHDKKKRVDDVLDKLRDRLGEEAISLAGSRIF